MATFIKSAFSPTSFAPSNAAPVDDYPADISTGAFVKVGDSATGQIETENDRDWFRVNFFAGVTYQIDLEGSPTNKGTLTDPYIWSIYDSKGVSIPGTYDDDDGDGLNARLSFTPAKTGDYFIAAAGVGNKTGTYKLSVSRLGSPITLAGDFIESGKPGYAVGTLTVTDPYDKAPVITVEDSRFVIDRGVLKLKADQSLLDTTAARVSVKITVTDKLGSFHRTFKIGIGQQITGTNAAETLPAGGSGGVGSDRIFGLAGNDVLLGGAGDDLLDGGAGADTMTGGVGDDIYGVDNPGDMVSELTGEGTDTVRSSITYSLVDTDGTGGNGGNIENLTLIGAAAIDGTGNMLANHLTGNKAANRLNGGGGVDVMEGGGGNDTYVVDDEDDQIVELAGGGTDLVRSSVDFELSNHVENLTLTGDADIDGTGNDLNNTIIGNDGDNVLRGGAGADVLRGATGDDDYHVELLKSGKSAILVDTIVENLDEGDDWIYLQAENLGLLKSSTLTLPANLENIDAENTGNNKLDFTGNAAGNRIWGNAADNAIRGLAGNDELHGDDGNDTLIGGTGADRMLGGAGDDTYELDQTRDVVVEQADQGTDTVRIAFAIDEGTYALPVNVENAQLANAVDYNLTGNGLNNLLMGNARANTLDGGAGNDRLDGGAGADIMKGGTGDDTYVVDNAADTVTENAAEGTDRVESSIGYTLKDHFEHLALTGNKAINGTGNGAANFILGNDGVNTLQGLLGNDLLQGMAGNDSLTDAEGQNLLDGGQGNDRLTGGAANELLVGGAGNDTLTPGAGHDIILFNKGDGKDAVNATSDAHYTLSLGGKIAYADLSFSKTGNDLIFKISSADQITFKDWYAPTDPRKSVFNLQVLAKAMEGFDPAGDNPLLDDEIETFNFAELVHEFDLARQDPKFKSPWKLLDSLLEFHLGGPEGVGSNTAALGGDLAYQYGLKGTLAGIGVNAAQGVIGDAQFGQTAQTLNEPATWTGEAVKLG